MYKILRNVRFFDLYNDEIKTDILNYYKYVDSVGVKHTNIFGWQSQFIEFPFIKDWYYDFIETLKSFWYIYNFGYYEQELTDNEIIIKPWFNINFTGAYNKIHTHHMYLANYPGRDPSLNNVPIKGVSCVYYVSLPEGNEKSFYVSEDGHTLNHLHIQEGDFVLFSTETLHGTIKNPSVDPRISISLDMVSSLDI